MGQVGAVLKHLSGENLPKPPSLFVASCLLEESHGAVVGQFCQQFRHGLLKIGAWLSPVPLDE
jgi:hypothetical protein